MNSFHHWQGDDLLLQLYVQPNAKKDEFVGEYDHKLKVRISAPPVDNKANSHLVKFLAKTFAVSTSRIKLLKGENQRIKRVKIVMPAKLPELLKISRPD